MNEKIPKLKISIVELYSVHNVGKCKVFEPKNWAARGKVHTFEILPCVDFVCICVVFAIFVALYEAYVANLYMLMGNSKVEW